MPQYVLFEPPATHVSVGPVRLRLSGPVNSNCPWNVLLYADARTYTVPRWCRVGWCRSPPTAPSDPTGRPGTRDRLGAIVTRVTERVPTLVDLPRPRALSEVEHALVTRLAAFVDVPTLNEQIGTVLVVSTCDCGCASVGLRSEGPQVPATVVARLSRTGRDDYFAVYAAGGGDVSVVLHVIGGLVEDLEIFAGEGVTVAAPPAHALTDLWIQ